MSIGTQPSKHVEREWAVFGTGAGCTCVAPPFFDIIGLFDVYVTPRPAVFESDWLSAAVWVTVKFPLSLFTRSCVFLRDSDEGEQLLGSLV